MWLTLLTLNPRFGLLWLLGTWTGLRIGDLLKLRACDIGELIWVQEQKTGRITGKFLTESNLKDARFFIAKLGVKPHEYIFYSRKDNKNKPMTRQWAHRFLSRVARVRGHKHVGAHSMRKIYACDMFRNTGSFEAVQKALGHKYISTTMLYLSDLLFDMMKRA